MGTLGGRGKDQLRRGQPIYVPDTGTDEDLARAAAGGPASLAVFPVFDGDALVALLYVDSAEPDFCPGTDVEPLAKVAALARRAVRRPRPARGLAPTGRG